MSHFNIHEAKTHLSRLINEALAGKEVIISKRNKPVVKLVALTPGFGNRQLGTAKGLMRMSEDFEEELDDFSAYRS